MPVHNYKNDKELTSKIKSIVIELDSDEQEKIKAAAKSTGLSVQKYILKAVRERMARGNYPRHLSGAEDDTVEISEEDKPYMPRNAGEEQFSPIEEEYILNIMRENYAHVPTVGEFERMSDETQMHTTQRLLAYREKAVERLMTRRYVEEIMG